VSGVKVKGQDELLAKLEKIGGRIEDPAAAADALGEVFRERFRARFDTGGDGDWPALTERTLERKARQGWPDQQLRATGALENAILGGRVEGGQNQVRYVADIPLYGAILDARSTRPPFELLRDADPELVAAIIEELDRFIAEAMR
jgi:hypothetical protein